MKTSITAVLLWLALLGGIIYTSVNGIIMCFKASVILGVLSLFVQGAGSAESLVYWLGGYDIASHLAKVLGIS